MFKGGCLCRSVRYSIAARPIAVRNCWCRVCQYLACGNSAVSAAFPTEGFSVQGEMNDFVSIADSGNRMHRRFCPRCGTQLFSEAEERPHLVFVRVGTLDDPSSAAPGAVIWTAEAPSWAFIDPRLEHWAGQPPPPPFPTA